MPQYPEKEYPDTIGRISNTSAITEMITQNKYARSLRMNSPMKPAITNASGKPGAGTQTPPLNVNTRNTVNKKSGVTNTTSK